MRRVLSLALLLATAAWAADWEEGCLKLTNGCLLPVTFEFSPEERISFSPRNSLSLPATSVTLTSYKDCFGPLKIIVMEDGVRKELISLPVITYNTEIFVDTLRKVTITPQRMKRSFPGWLIDEVRLDADNNLAEAMARFREAHESGKEPPCSCLCGLLMEYETKALNPDYKYCIHPDYIPALVEAFKEQYPEVKTSLSEDEIYEAEKQLLEEGIKIHPHDPRLQTTSLQ